MYKTAQQIFDQVSKHLLTQMRQAKVVWSGLVCRYKIVRDGQTLRCAVGCLIPDELYSNELEGWSVPPVAFYDQENPIPNLLKVCNIDTTPEILSLLRKLQHIHDKNTPETWHRLLKQLAEDEGLVFNT
jgi:hypothetical protein